MNRPIHSFLLPLAQRVLRAVPRTVQTALWAAAACIWLWGCGAPTETVGIETTNGEIVVGRVSEGAGSPVLLARVRITPTGDSALQSWRDTADATGRFRFTGVPSGRYVLSVPSASGAAGIRSRLEKSADSLIVPALRTAAPVRLIGRVLPPEGTLPEAVTVCIPGLESCARPASDSVYELAGAPRGDFELAFLSGTSVNYLPIRVGYDGKDTVFLRDVRVSAAGGAQHTPYTLYESALSVSLATVPVAYPATETPAWYVDRDLSSASYLALNARGELETWDAEPWSQWQHDKEIDIAALLRTPPPAGGIGDLPLLLRLRGGDFDFAQAAPDGRDIRFSRLDGASLPFEVERWDAAAGEADIWIRAAGLAAADKHIIRMFWGNPLAPAHSDGAAVFAPAGYAIVFHLASSAGPGAPAAQALNSAGPWHATVQRPDGGALALDSLATPGSVGQGISLAGGDTILLLPHHPAFERTEALTLSVWAKNRAAINPANQTLAGRWAQGRRVWNFGIDGAGRLELHIADGADFWKGASRTREPVPDLTQWNHLAVTYDRGTIRFYINGEEVPSEIGPTTQVVPTRLADKPYALSLGGTSDHRGGWNGELDEFRLAPHALPAGWIRLEYLNQR